MKTSKRLLSLFLAVVMALTACSVGFVAFAQEINPKDNPAFSDKNASKEGSVEALTQLVDEFLPDILKLVPEENLDKLGLSIDSITNADFNDDKIKSDRFYEFMAELSPLVISAVGGVSKYSVLSDAKASMGANFLDDLYYAYLDKEDAKLNFWTLYSICSKNAKENGNEFEQLCFKYMKGFTDKSGNKVMGLEELIGVAKKVKDQFDYQSAFKALEACAKNIGLTNDKHHSIEKIKELISSYEQKNGAIDTKEFEAGYPVLEYMVQVAGVDVKISDLATALLYFQDYGTILNAAISNRFANDGGADFTKIKIEGEFNYTNWEQKLRASNKKYESYTREKLGEEYAKLFIHPRTNAIFGKFKSNINDGITKFYNTDAKTITNNFKSIVVDVVKEVAIAKAISKDLANYAYDDAKYPFDANCNKYLINIANEAINNTINGVTDKIPGAIKPFINNVISHLTRTTVDGKKLKLDQILSELNNIYINVAKDPITTVSNLTPLVTVLIDEIVLPLVFNQKGDAFGPTGMINLNTIIGMILTEEQIKDFGIGKPLELDLNRIVPDVLNYIQGTADPTNGFHDADKKIPNIFNIKIIDEALGKYLPNYKFIDLIKQQLPKEYGKVVEEVIKNAVPVLDKSVKAYLDGDEQLGITAHRKDATIAKELILGLENTTMGRGLNNISIALPTVLDIMGKMMIAENSIDSDWEYANRITYKKDVQVGNLISGSKFTQVENATVWALKVHALDKTKDPSNVTGWVIEYLLSTLGNGALDLINDVVSTDNEFTKVLPLITAAIDAFGGFTDLSVLTDVVNGLFGLTRDSKYSFTFAERAIPYATNETKYVGLSEDSVFYLIANASPLIRSIMNIVEANKATTNNVVAPYAQNAKAATIKVPNFDDVLTAENTAASKELLSMVDELLANILKNSQVDGFDVADADGIISAVFTFITNHIGKDATEELMHLVQEYLDVINAANTDGNGQNGNKDGKVNVKKVYSRENLSTLVKETYVLIEKVVDIKLSSMLKGDISIVTGAVKGLISPGAVAVRSDALKTNDKLVKATSWAKVKDNNIGYEFKDGDKDAFFTNLYDSLGAVTSVLGFAFCATGYYENVLVPILNPINTACGIAELPKTVADGEELLIALTNSGANLLNAIAKAPASTILSVVKGLSSVLQDKSIKPILKDILKPLENEVIGIITIVNKIAPSIAEIKFGEIKLPQLTLPLTLSTILLALNMAPGFIGSTKNIAVQVINKVAAQYVVLPDNMPWDKFANAKPEELLLMIYAIVKESGFLPELPFDTDKISSVFTLVKEILAVTGSKTEAYWAFDHYIGKAKDNFKFPTGITQADADKAIGQLDNIVKNVFPLLKQLGVINQNNLSEVLSGVLYTNGTLTSIATAVYGGLESVLPMFTPAVVAGYLTDSSYGTTYKAAAKTLNDAQKWADVKSLNWGFTDGSAKAQQGFINGVAAIFRPVNDILAVLLADGSFDIVPLLEEIASKEIKQEGTTASGLKYTVIVKDGILNVTLLNTQSTTSKPNTITVDLKTVIKGLIESLGGLKLNGSNGYESAIVPLLEAFMCEDVKTYDQYLKDYKKNKDALLTNILNPLFGFVNKLAAAPFDTLTAVLPNIAYFIDNNGVAQFVDNLLAPFTKSIIPALEKEGIDVDKLIADALGKDLGTFVADKLGVNVKLNISLKNLTACNIHEIVLPLINKILANNNMNITLPAFDWATLASHGKQTTVRSAAKNSDGDYSTIRIVANQGETLVAVLRYISQTLISNSTAIKNIISSMDGVKNNKTIVDVLNCVFNQIKTAHKDDIVRAIFYFLLQEPENRFFDYRNFKFKEYEFNYPETLDMEFLNVMAPMVDGILTGVLGQFVPGGLPGMVTGNIYKDDIINKLVGLYGQIEKVSIDKNTKLIDILAMSDLDFTTAHFAELLTDKSYGKSYDGVAKTIAKAGSWSNVNTAKLSWGVTDRDSFLHALAAVLRPMYGVLDVLLNDGALGLFDLVYIPGTDGYTSTVVPFMEAFGLYNIKTQYQYREDMSKQYDAILLDILNPLMDKVEDILNAPIQMLTDILPNLALFFANDGLLQIIENLTAPINALLKTLEPIVNVNDVLKAAGLNIDKELAKLGISGVHFNIYDLAGSLKPVIGAENIVGVLNGVLKSNNIAIELMPIDWYQLASHGKLISDQASQAATFGSRMFVESERNETLVAVLRYLINTVNYKGNFQIISDLVTGMIGGADPSISDVINQVLGMLQGETDVVLSDLCGLLQTFA